MSDTELKEQIDESIASVVNDGAELRSEGYSQKMPELDQLMRARRELLMSSLGGDIRTQANFFNIVPRRD